MPRDPHFDPAFRPDYWAPGDPIAAITHNIKGQLRREMIRDIVSGNASRNAPNDAIADALRQVEPGLLEDELEEPLGLERLDPRWMGGEYLPPYEPGEVEIARIVLESTTMDVYSFRAVRAGGRIHYRCVDEYNSPMEVTPASSEQPLTGGEVAGLIDSLVMHGFQHPGQDFCTFDLDWRAREDGWSRLEEFEQYARFFHVESPFYPGLDRHYVTRFDVWARDRYGKVARGEAL